MVELATTAVNESVAQAERPVLEQNRTGDCTDRLNSQYLRNIEIRVPGGRDR
jgi:hypothetical protein